MRIRMGKRTKLILGILILAIGFNFFLTYNYTIVSPGLTVELKDIVTVEEGTKDGKGSFFLTTVSSRELNLPLLFYHFMTKDTEIEKKADVIPPGWDMQEYMDYMRSWMQESQKIAEVVALKKMGYDPQIRGDGAQVVEVMKDSPAKDLLRPDDVIKKINSNPVNLAEEVIQEVSKEAVGSTLMLEIDRQGEIKDIPVVTMESKSEKGKAIIGVYITTLNWEPVLPLEIDIDVGDIVGPSAGSMFAMEILNQLSPEDMTKGRKIAGTGTIGLDEKVGEIGGVKQKVIAAHRDGAEVFFTPEKNAPEAIKAAENLDIDIVSVKTLDDIISHLLKTG